MNAGRASACIAQPLRAAEIEDLFTPWRRYRHIALAVSGGADSMALMIAAHAWHGLGATLPSITILTVDHRLRPEAATEAAWVKSECVRLGLAHETLVWNGPKPGADLQAAARDARYALMLSHCRAAGIDALATAHNAEDQAETLLMRLARGSGLDGLAGIAPFSMRGGVALLRPFLGIQRARLEATLHAAGAIWREDPSNHDTRFERVRLREMLRARALPLTAEKLSLSARRLERARVALDAATADLLRGAARVHPAGFAEVDLACLRAAPDEIAVRALARLMAVFGGGQRPARLVRVEALHEALRAASPRAATLGGCLFEIRRGALRVSREFGRIDAARLPLPKSGALLWDGRFRVLAPAVAPPDIAGLRVGPLGRGGIAILRAGGGDIALPAHIAYGLPALWRGEHLAFAPFAAFSDTYLDGWTTDAAVVFVAGERIAEWLEGGGKAMFAH